MIEVNRSGARSQKLGNIFLWHGNMFQWQAPVILENPRSSPSGTCPFPFGSDAFSSLSLVNFDRDYGKPRDFKILFALRFFWEDLCGIWCWSGLIIVCSGLVHSRRKLGCYRRLWIDTAGRWCTLRFFWWERWRNNVVDPYCGCEFYSMEVFRHLGQVGGLIDRSLSSECV